MSQELVHTTENHQPINGYWQARQRLAKACRELGNLLLNRDSSEQELAHLTNEIEILNEKLRTRQLLEGKRGRMDCLPHEALEALSIEVSPLIGKSSMVGPELKIWVEGGSARARVAFDWRFEGPLKCAHGGYIAAVFDEFLGWAQMLSGGSGATKNLSITYHKPTPLNTELELRAAMMASEGRKICIEGEMYAGETLTASAQGLFISFGEKGTTELHRDL